MKKILTLRGQRKKKIPIEAGIWFSAPSPPWIDLPADLTANILHRLGPVEILQTAQKVCATWWRVCKDPYMWRVIHMFDPGHEQLELFRDFATMDLSYLKISYMCRLAVEHRCQGGLIDFSVGYFCTDNLLRYVCDRGSSRRLKRLTIASTRITTRALMSAVIGKVGAGLEELRLFYSPFDAFDEDLETIGIRCPLLNTLAFDMCFWPRIPPGAAAAASTDYDDICALAIGKNMPNLRHLELLSGDFSEKGLQAILDGCPRLESLNLRRSRVVGLEEGDLRKRCSWIKDVRLPCDSAWLDDYELDEEEEEYDRQEGDEYRLVHIAATNEDAQMNCRTGTLVFNH